MKQFIATLAAILVAAGIIMFIKSAYDDTKRMDRINEQLREQSNELVKHARERAGY